MTVKEAERFRLMKNHDEGILTLMEVSNLLSLGYRQTLRLWKCYQNDGAKALVSKKHNNQNRSLDISKESTILKLIKEHYLDYKPTLTSEKLEEKHQIKVSKETIRKIKIKHGLHQPKKKKKIKTYQRRKRRNCVGELVQVDGSPHNWFEERGPYCTLLLAIDDATGKIMAARFEYEETTAGYFQLMKYYLKKHGKPICLYTDKYGSFRVNQGEDRSKLTQFTRAMKQLDIQMIAAHSPQAKGRVERANGVLQDRLVKELRENGIRTMDEANEFFPSYIEKYNKRFGKKPANTFDGHRKLEINENLDQILCKYEHRKITKNLEISYKNQIFQIQEPNRVNSLRGANVQVIEGSGGEIIIEYKGEFLSFVKYEEIEMQPSIIDQKELVSKWERSSKGHKPGKNHPWR